MRSAVWVGLFHLMGILQQALGTPTSISINPCCLTVMLDGRPVGRGCVERAVLKAQGLCWEAFQMHPPSRLWLQAPSEKHKCLIPREWLLVIIIKEGFEGFLEISFYKIVFGEFERKSSRNMDWNSPFPYFVFQKHFIFKWENNVCVWLKNAINTEEV